MNKQINLIGISGKIGSGKDTVGKMIQYFTNTAMPEYTEATFFEELARDNFYGKELSQWQIKKYADKLKDIVCILIGCTRADLEDHDFKNKPLGEEWDVYRELRADVITDKAYPYYLYPANSDFKKHFNRNPEKITPRDLLQLIGTNCIRNIVHPNGWINATFADWDNNFMFAYHKVLEYVNNDERFEGINIYQDVKTLCKEILSKKEYDNMFYSQQNWIITDVRFPNEVEAIKKRGGIVIRINRDQVFMNQKRAIKTKEQGFEHPSETALDDYKDFDVTINNHGTLEDLFNEVKLFVHDNNL